jgi:hypothetical protein
MDQRCKPTTLDVCANILGLQPVVPPGYTVIPVDQCVPIAPSLNAFSQGVFWRNGSQPFWNTLIAQVDAQAPGWRQTPAPNDYIRQALDWLANRWMLGGQCAGVSRVFGQIQVSCSLSYEDIVSTPSQTGPFYLVELSIHKL